MRFFATFNIVQRVMEARASTSQPMIVRMKHGRLVKELVPRHRRVELTKIIKSQETLQKAAIYRELFCTPR